MTPVLEVTDLQGGYGAVRILNGIDLYVEEGEFVTIIGPNGSGKSTLLKILMGEVEADTGKFEWGHAVKPGYFSQEHGEVQGNEEATIHDWLWTFCPDQPTGFVRAKLAEVLFGKDEIDKKIGALSGGELARLVMAKISIEEPTVLVLDEPTNHLDIASRQVLEEAIRQFGGAVCIVSHDRFFLNEVVERVVHIEHGDLTEYLGDYDYYKWSREQLLAEEQGEGGDQGDDGLARTSTGALTKKELRRVLAELRERRMAESGDLRAEVTSLEKRIEEGEARKAELEAMMADPEIYQDAERLPEVSREYNQLGEEIVGLMERWEEKLFELEEIDERYEAEEAALRGDL